MGLEPVHQAHGFAAGFANLYLDEVENCELIHLTLKLIASSSLKVKGVSSRRNNVEERSGHQMRYPEPRILRYIVSINCGE